MLEIFFFIILFIFGVVLAFPLSEFARKITEDYVIKAQTGKWKKKGGRWHLPWCDRLLPVSVSTLVFVFVVKLVMFPYALVFIV